MGKTHDNELIGLTETLLQRLPSRPVLVDVGASAKAPPIWRTFARQSIYVGFDPSLREMRQENGGRFHRAFILNEAVVCGPGDLQAHGDCTSGQRAHVTFQLTR